MGGLRGGTTLLGGSVQKHLVKPLDVPLGTMDLKRGVAELSEVGLGLSGE